MHLIIWVGIRPALQLTARKAGICTIINDFYMKASSHLLQLHWKIIHTLTILGLLACYDGPLILSTLSLFSV